MEPFEKEFINKVIWSRDVKNWVLSTEHKFTAEEKVSLIINSTLSMQEKMNLLTTEFSDLPESSEILHDVREIISGMKYIQKALHNQKHKILAIECYDEDNDTMKCFDSFDYLVKYIKKHNIDNVSTVKLINTITSDIIAYINFNSNTFEIEGYTFNKCVRYKNLDIEDTFIDLDIKFNIGDIVRVYGSNKRYVVCNNSEIPEQLKSKCDITDTCVTVIPIEVLDNTKDLREQINNLIKNEIHNLSGNDMKPSLISTYHEHILTTLVEKERDNDEE